MLSVVIPTYNDGHCLELTLRSLTRQTLPVDQFEVIVVQDGRMSGYEGIERHATGLDLRVEALPQRRGRAGARNAGVALARGRTVLFLDSDCYAEPQLLARHLEFHDARSGAHVLLGNRYAIDWEQMVFVLRDEPVPAELLARDECRDPKFSGVDDASIPECMETPWLFAHSNNTSIARETLGAIGGFDEEFGTKWGWEDLELFYRVYLHLGSAESFGYDAEAACYHLLQHRDQLNFYHEMFENEPVLKRIHPNIDWEFHSLRMPAEVSAKVRYYRGVIDRCLKSGTGQLAPVWGRLEPTLAAAGRVLWIGTGTADVPLPAGAMTFDYQQPASSSNYHLVGTSIPAPTASLGGVVSVDFWRCLQWYDLCDFLRESTRVAPFVLLVHTKAADVPGDAMKSAGELDYLLRALAPKFHVAVDRGSDGVTVLMVRKRTTH